MNLSTILNPLTEMAYPTQFSMQSLLEQPSYIKKLAYASLHLKKIASGSARVVFQIDDEKVLKVAKNTKGLDQNKAEADWGTQRYEICAKRFETSEHGYFLEMELARKITPAKFKKLLGFSLDTLWSFLHLIKKGNTRDKQQIIGDGTITLETMNENEWVQNLTSFIFNYDYPYPGDFGCASTYGIVSRPEGDTVVLIDFGLSQEVLDTHYSHMR